MARKNDSPQKAAMREMMRDYLKNNDISIKNGTDVNSIMRDMMSVLLEGALDEELDEELGYSKYDYRNKNTDNSRNGHSQKTMNTSYGDMEVAIPRDRNGEYEPQLIKKYQNTVTQDMEEKILSMYAKGMTTGDIESHIGVFLYPKSKEGCDIMYIENLPSGQFKYIERYKDPMSLKWKRVSITLDKNDRKTRKMAEEHLQSKIDAILNTSDISFLTFSELVEKYLTYQEKNVRISTYKRNKFSTNFLKKALGKDTLVQNLNARYIREQLDKNCDINSKKNEYLVRLKALLRWGYQNDYIETVEYLNKLTPYKADSKRVKLEDKYLEANEIKTLLTSMNTSSCTVWIDLTEFLILSGLRIGEAIALEKADISNEHISVTKTYDKVNDEIRNAPKTEMSNREVFIQDELQKLIDRIYLHNRIRKVTGKFLFCDTEGNHVNYDSYRKFLRIHSEKVLGRRITPHALRHTHASLLIAKGIDIEAISRRLGHTNSRITREIYIHIMEELKEKDKDNLRKLKIM